MDDRILRRIRNEFIEMPGLQLTIKQAQRLWDLNEETCNEVLVHLVEAKFLCRTGFELYGRLTEEAVRWQSSRMAKVI